MTASDQVIVRIARLVSAATCEKFVYLCEMNHTLDCRCAVWLSLTDYEKRVFAALVMVPPYVCGHNSGN